MFEGFFVSNFLFDLQCLEISEAVIQSRFRELERTGLARDAVFKR
jgi:hypothetical protein